jgi:hypothetical protein
MDSAAWLLILHFATGTPLQISFATEAACRAELREWTVERSVTAECKPLLDR